MKSVFAIQIGLRFWRGIDNNRNGNFVADIEDATWFPSKADAQAIVDRMVFGGSKIISKPNTLAQEEAKS